MPATVPPVTCLQLKPTAIYEVIEEDRSATQPYLSFLKTVRTDSHFLHRKSRLQRQMARLAQLSALPIGWDSYHADPPGPNAIANAGRILQEMSRQGLSPTRILPSVEGGLTICFVSTGHYADLECLNTGEMLGARYRGQDESFVWEIRSDQDLAQAVGQIKTFFCA
jgi:hypothetical protein